MKIAKHPDGAMTSLRLRADIEEFFRPAGGGDPVCGANCERSAPRNCSRHCPDIARALSSEPDRFPLEDGIAPLAFELKRLGVFHPCWSCEGHLRRDGSLWKVPVVWFYCDSVVQIRVLAQGLEALYQTKRLNVRWQVVTIFSDDGNTETTFSLEPRRDEGDPSLAALQDDVGVIAAHLRESVLGEARRLSRATD